ncbi:hypothetical protein [Nocardia asteroides]|uniref:hypothetical protein n=1 Tax=Nocardia asteroides TaxID=1824 RepID=UPI00342445A0
MAMERPPGDGTPTDDHPFAKWQRRPMMEVPESDQPAVREWIFRPTSKDRMQADRASRHWFYRSMLHHATDQAAKSLRDLGRSLRLLDAGDISHEVMARIEQRLPNRMRADGAWRAYLGVATRQRVFEELRKVDGPPSVNKSEEQRRKPRTTYLPESAEHLYGEHTDTAQQDWIPLRDQLRREVPPRLRDARDRAVFDAWMPIPDYVWDMDSHRSRREIAELVGLDESMVQRTQEYIKTIMRDVLRRWLGDDDD